MPQLKRPNIQKPSELLLLKCLIYGDAGVGKTRFLGTAQLDERTSPALILDFEGGTSTLSGLDIGVIQVRDWKDYNEAHAWLAAGDHGYKSVAIDSVSETHWYALSNLMELRDAGTRKIDDVNDMQEYGQALVQLRRFLREFRDLPLHVFYTCHAKDERDPREGNVKKPSLAGKAANEILGVVDVAAYLTFGKIGEGASAEERRILVLKNYPKIRAKTRTSWTSDAPDELIDPTVTSLLDAVSIPK
jgi:phage nucleotide-binding protein